MEISQPTTARKGLAFAAALALLATMLVAITSTPAYANTVVVGTTVDINPIGDCSVPAECSLRSALAIADSDATIDTVEVPPGTYVLAEGQLEINAAVTVVGVGGSRDQIVIDANNGSRIFFLRANEVTFRNLTLRNGGNADVDYGGAIYFETEFDLFEVDDVAFLSNAALSMGGAIYLEGLGGDMNVRFTDAHFVGNEAGEGGAVAMDGWSDLQVSNSTFTDNEADYGGAVLLYAYYGDETASLVGSTFTNNEADDYGGAVYFESDSGSETVSYIGSTFTSNTADYGGAIYHEGGSALLTASSFVNNSASSDGGAAYLECYNDCDIESFEVRNSTFTGNTADEGGGLFAYGWDRLVVTGSTFSGNTADYGAGLMLYAWADSEDETTIVNSTFTGNTATTSGGAAYLEGGSSDRFGTTLFHHVTIADNVGGGILVDADSTTEVLLGNSIIVGSNSADCETSGSFISLGGNIDGDGTCGLTQDSDQPETDPGLLALASNGGPTQTRAITDASPAYEAGEGEVCLPADQRGVDRKDDCDVGAFELVITDDPTDPADPTDPTDPADPVDPPATDDAVEEAVPAEPIRAQPQYTG